MGAAARCLCRLHSCQDAQAVGVRPVVQREFQQVAVSREGVGMWQSGRKAWGRGRAGCLVYAPQKMGAAVSLCSTIRQQFPTQLQPSRAASHVCRRDCGKKVARDQLHPGSNPSWLLCPQSARGFDDR